MREIAHVLRTTKRGYVRGALPRVFPGGDLSREVYGNPYRGYAGAYIA